MTKNGFVKQPASEFIYISVLPLIISQRITEDYGSDLYRNYVFNTPLISHLKKDGIYLPNASTNLILGQFFLIFKRLCAKSLFSPIFLA